MKDTLVSDSSSPSLTHKRSRDPEDEVYLDNFHSHKRYFSEIMASSLNGLTVGDSSLPENLIESPARSESMCYFRDEMSLQYSPMSEDCDDARYSEAPPNTSMSQPESRPTSPGSPHRYYRPLNGYSSTTSTLYPSFGCPPTSATCPQPRQRGSDSEGRFPSSPSDICHSADLRRAALLRSVQMRVHPLAPPAYELSFSPEHEPTGNIEAQEHPCSCVKPVVNDCECPHPQQGPNSFADCCSSMGMSESEISREKPCRVLDMNVREEDSRKAFGGDRLGRTDLMSS